MSAATDPPSRAAFIESEDGQKSFLGDDDDVSVQYDSGADAYVVRDEGASEDVLQVPVDGSTAVKVLNRNLRLATGQGIEDPSDNLLVEVATEAPRFNYHKSDGSSSELIRDETGGFSAVKYINSSGPPSTLELTNAILVPPSAGQRNIGTSSLYFNEMHATEFTTHSPEPRSVQTAWDGVHDYLDGYGSMDMGEKIADLMTVIEQQEQRINELEAKLN